MSLEVLCGSKSGRRACAETAESQVRFQGHPMEKSWLDAIKKVLRETEAPLHYTEISEQVLSRDYYVTDGATPASTVNAHLRTGSAGMIFPPLSTSKMLIPSCKSETFRTRFARLSKSCAAAREEI